MIGTSQSEFARSKGIHKSRVSQLVAQGMPREQDGSIEPDAASSWMAEHLDPDRQQAYRLGQEAQPGKRALREDVREDILHLKREKLSFEMQKNLGLFMLKEDVTTFMSIAFQAKRDTVRNQIPHIAQLASREFN